jgi:hypothetical protein
VTSFLIKLGLNPPPVEADGPAGGLLTGVIGFLVCQPGLNGSDFGAATGGVATELLLLFWVSASFEFPAISGVSGVEIDFGLGSAVMLLGVLLLLCLADSGVAAFVIVT